MATHAPLPCTHRYSPNLSRVVRDISLYPARGGKERNTVQNNKELCSFTLTTLDALPAVWFAIDTLKLRWGPVEAKP